MQGGYGGPPPGGGGGYGGPPPGSGYGAPPGGGYGAPPGGNNPYGPPPGGGYGPGPGGYAWPGYQPPGANPYAAMGGAPMAVAGGGLRPDAANYLTDRSSVLVVLLSFVTCGIYQLIWKYQTTDELRLASGDESLKPGMDLLLTFVTCGLWAIFVDYRNAKKTSDLLKGFGVQRDQSTAIILCVIFGVPFIAWYLLQEEYNALARAARGQPI